MRSPTIKLELRGNDPTGHGHFGAKRGSGSHKGCDFKADPDEAIFAPIDGYVTKIGIAYSSTSRFKYIDIKNEVYRVRLMYVAPMVKKGDRIFEGQQIGMAQDIAEYWNPRMINHIHIETYKHGLRTDPEPLFVTAY